MSVLSVVSKFKFLVYQAGRCPKKIRNFKKDLEISSVKLSLYLMVAAISYHLFFPFTFLFPKHSIIDILSFIKAADFFNITEELHLWDCSVFLETPPLGCSFCSLFFFFFATLLGIKFFLYIIFISFDEDSLLLVTIKICLQCICVKKNWNFQMTCWNFTLFFHIFL